MTHTIESVLDMISDKPIDELSGDILLNFSDAGCIFLNAESGEGKLVDSDKIDHESLDCKVIISLEDFSKLISGELDATSAYMDGRLQVSGDMGLAMELSSWID
tara:strand:- start:90 stop:401 length:312 start_codon:yes stop_codon:yes gene_type:complete